MGLGREKEERRGREREREIETDFKELVHVESCGGLASPKYARPKTQEKAAVPVQRCQTSFLLSKVSLFL